MLIPVQDSHTSQLILGVLGCLKLILPYVNKTEKNHEMQGSFGTRQEINEINFSLDRLLQVSAFYFLPFKIKTKIVFRYMNYVCTT